MARPIPGVDIYASDADQAEYFGSVADRNPEACAVCDGQGWLTDRIASACAICNGTGYKPTHPPPPGGTT